MRRITTIAELRGTVAAARADGARIGLLPTMGALHEGHLANARLLAPLAGLRVVSVFVNPTQFDRPDDLTAYPRDLEGDEAALATLGDDAPDVVFAPSVEEVYRDGSWTTVHVEGLADVLEGASRPGHFDGVATVVTKLCNMVQPDLAVFGRKDIQQLAVIRALVRDLDLPVQIVPAPTVRESDGVALSSRNRHLSPHERGHARALSSALVAAVHEARSQRAASATLDVATVDAAARRVLDADPGVALDYLAVVDPATFRPPHAPVRSDARLCVAVAAQVGPVRLIDNVEVGDTDDEGRLLAATGRDGAV